MDYSLEKISTLAECDAMLDIVRKEKELAERKKLDQSDDLRGFEVKTTEINNELESVTKILENFIVFLPNLPEGKEKKKMELEISRYSMRKTVLLNQNLSYNIYALLEKQLDYNLMEPDVAVIDAFILQLEAKRATL